MPEFDSGGVRIHYTLAGSDDGPPTLLVHGFASDYWLNWGGSRWQDTMERAGRLVIGPDLRGHGSSAKPHDRLAYSLDALAGDMVALLDHLSIDQVDLVGYSLGGRIGVHLLLHRPGRIRRAVLGGLGVLGPIPNAAAIAAGLRGAEIDHPVAAAFHIFATGRAVNDLEALAACIEGEQPPVSRADLARIAQPVLMVTGERDELAPDSAEIAAAMAAGSYLELPGRDHMSAITSRQFKQAAVDFFSDQ